MPISLKWTLTTEFPVKCFVLVLDYHAHSEIGEYTIHGPELRHAPGTRNFENCYVVSYTRSPALRGRATIASARVGEARTLREAKTVAQRHYLSRAGR